MITEEEQIQSRVDKLNRQIEMEKRVIEISEPFEMLLDNDYFKKVQGYYKESADIYQKKINDLVNDMASDGTGNEMGGFPENAVFRHLRISDIISKCVVARDTLLAFVNEPKQIIERAKSSQEKIDSIKQEIIDLEENNNATGK